MLSVYSSADWQGFVARMRAAPTDATVPLIAADWLDEHGKAEHAAFVRACCRLSELWAERKRLEEDGAGPGKRTYRSQRTLAIGTETERINAACRDSITRFLHEWTSGAARTMHNPTASDWPLGFLRYWSVRPFKVGSGREPDPNARRKLAALLGRQPVIDVQVLFPNGSVFNPTESLQSLSREHPGVRFYSGDSRLFDVVPCEYLNGEPLPETSA